MSVSELEGALSEGSP